MPEVVEGAPTNANGGDQNHVRVWDCDAGIRDAARQPLTTGGMMNPEVQNWLKKQGPIGILILFLWLFRDQISFTIQFGSPPAAAVVSASGDPPGRETPSPVAQYEERDESTPRISP